MSSDMVVFLILSLNPTISKLEDLIAETILKTSLFIMTDQACFEIILDYLDIVNRIFIPKVVAE